MMLFEPDKHQGGGRRAFNQLFLAPSLRARAELDARVGLPESRARRQASGAFRVALRDQLARPLKTLGATDQVVLRFLTGWTPSTRALASEFSAACAPAHPCSLRAAAN
jgi:hypothetical protein